MKTAFTDGIGCWARGEYTSGGEVNPADAARRWG